VADVEHEEREARRAGEKRRPATVTSERSRTTSGSTTSGKLSHANDWRRKEMPVQHLERRVG
jgi:hypothetical protein